MTRILFALLLFVTAVAQATILPRVNPISVSPDFILVMLFLWSSSHGMRESLGWIFFTGILLDVLTLDSFGSNALALMVVVLLSGSGGQRFFQFNLVIPIVMVFGATVVHGAVLCVLRDAPLGLWIVFQGAVHAILLPVLLVITRLFSR